MTDMIGGVVVMVGGGLFQLAGLATLRRPKSRAVGIAAVLPFTPTPPPDPLLDALLERAAAAVEALD